MTANDLIAAKKELGKLQKQLGKELARGKYKDTLRIQQLRKEIKRKKLSIGELTMNLLLQQDVD
ncbi:MAG: hypothetical protein LBC69_03065 [Eubacteriaceae bacterium]|jgi:hypothetical protein|nr:hypothetical protein [Eubacteriaceae bacterium]